MNGFSAAAHLEGLKDFQRNAVEQVIRRFFGEGAEHGSGRFLVADETGLGKSVIARGVVARTVEELSARGRESVTVLYICSNADLARQNLSRLDITGGRITPTSTRLSMLAKHPELLRDSHDLGGTRLNLVSFTPGTSFSRGSGTWRSGTAPERALLSVLLNRITDADEPQQEAAARLLQGPVSSLDRFVRRIRWTEEELGDDGPDPGIAEAFARISRESGSLERFLKLRDRAQHDGALEEGRASFDERWTLIHDLRADLARAGADALTPDLVILDEFQRFRNLMAAPGSPEDSAAAELARTLFGQRGSKLLLLSATPYSPYTAAEDEEDHHRDFLTVVDFLTGHDPSALEKVRGALGSFRRALQSLSASEQDRAQAAARVRETLLDVMSRSERPPLGENQDLVEVVKPEVPPPSAEDFADWIVMRRLARHLGSHISSAYWKSVPHFSTFMSDYQIGQKIRARIEEDDAELRALLRRTTRLTREIIDSGEEADLGSGLLRSLAEETVGSGWWRMLWLPPSMPYLQLAIRVGIARARSRRRTFCGACPRSSAAGPLLRRARHSRGGRSSPGPALCPRARARSECARAEPAPGTSPGPRPSPCTLRRR